MKTLRLSDELQYRLALVRHATEHDPDGLERRKVELADAVLAAVDRATHRRRATRLAQVRPQPIGIIEVELRRKRRPA